MVDQAVDRFYELSDAKNIEVVRHSNKSVAFGNTRDVVFKLLVDGKNGDRSLHKRDVFPKGQPSLQRRRLCARAPAFWKGR